MISIYAKRCKMDAIYIALLEILIARFELVVERPEARSHAVDPLRRGVRRGASFLAATTTRSGRSATRYNYVLHHFGNESFQARV